MCFIQFLLLLLLSVSGKTALSQSSSGQYSALLKTSIESIQAGNPNYKSMEPMLADAVEQQLTKMKGFLQSQGQIKSMSFLGEQSTPSGPAEYYRVFFERGSSGWLINTGNSGKITVLWTSGQ